MEPISRRSLLALGGAAALGGASVLGGTDPAEAADWKRLVVVTSNVGRKHPGRRERAIRDVRHAVKGALPIVGWQEIGGGDGDQKERAWINHYFADRYRNVSDFSGKYGAERQVPISVPNQYRILRRRTTRTHEGRKKVSPDRFVNQLLLQHVHDRKLKFVIANTHYVSGAWNHEHNYAETWRDEMWQQHFRRHRDRVLQYWRGLGYPVIWTGDVNRKRMPLLLPKFEHTASNAKTYDKVRWVTGTNGVQIKLKRTGKVDTHVDSHNAHFAVFEIRHRG